MIALSNGNISLFDNKNKSVPKKVKKKKSKGNQSEKSSSNPKKINKKSKRKSKDLKGDSDNMIKFNMNDINRGIKLMDLSDDDLERGMDIIVRTKKYMSPDEKKILIKVESLLDLVKGIKKLSNIDTIDYEESNFFRSMDEEDKKNMMIKEILEVFPEKRKESIEKAIDMKKKIELFAELFLPDDFGEGGFSLSSLASINNLGSANNLKLLGSLLRGEDTYEDYEDDEYEYYGEYEDEEYNDEDNGEGEDVEYEYEYEYIEYEDYEDDEEDNSKEN